MTTSYEEVDAYTKPHIRALHGLRQMSLPDKITSLLEVALWRVRATIVAV